MKTIKTSFLGLVFTALFLLSACGGGEEESKTAPQNVTPTKISGVWTINEKRDVRDCGNASLATDNYTATITQDGDNITVVTQAGTFSGSVNGTTVSWIGQYFDAAENGWMTLTSMALTFSENRLTGTSTWEFRAEESLPGGPGSRKPGAIICTGTTQITGTLNPDGGGSTATAPVAPSNLSGLAVSESAIRMNWSDNADNESNYKVERSLKEFSGFTQIASLGVNTTSHVASGLSPSTRYFFRVRATNSVGDSAYSNTINVITKEPAIVIPARPTGLSAIAVGNNITLNWTDNAANESFYKIERSLLSTSGFTEIASLGINSSRYVNTNLSGGTRYYYRVRATNSAGASSYSNTAAARTEVTPLSPPVLSSPSPITGPPITLRWTQDWDGLVLTGDGFELQQSLTSPRSGFVKIWNGDRTNEGMHVTVAPPGVTYYFRVRAIRPGASSPWSNVVKVSVLGPTNTIISRTPTLDNYLIFSSLDSRKKNKVSSRNELIVGCDYFKNLINLPTLCFGSTLYFNINADIAGKTINRAILKLYPRGLAADRFNPFKVHAFIGSWNTNTITWNNSPSFWRPGISFNPPFTTRFPVEIDVTSLVRKWADGSWENNGFMLLGTGSHPGRISIQSTGFCSSDVFDSVCKKPQLIVDFQ